MTRDEALKIIEELKERYKPDFFKIVETGGGNDWAETELEVTLGFQIGEKTD